MVSLGKLTCSLVRSQFERRCCSDVWLLGPVDVVRLFGYGAWIAPRIIRSEWTRRGGLFAGGRSELSRVLHASAGSRFYDYYKTVLG